MNTALWVIIGCGLLSVVYGAWATKSLLAADAGTARMQEIAAGSRGGRRRLSDAPVHHHRHRRRRRPRAGLGWLLGTTAAIGFLIGAVLSGAAGFIGMNVSVRANVRTAQAASK